MQLGITDRAALVLGSTSGIGGAIATTLASEGARVAFTGRRGDLAQQLAAQHPGSVAIEADLTDASAAATVVAQATAALGPLDILVLNSGGPAPGVAAGLTTAEVAGAVETLLIRQIEFVEGVLPGMRERGWGRIVAVGSTSVQEPLAGLALSNIARAGLAGYLKTLSREVAADGVTVNMVLPGRISTDRIATLDARRARETGVELAALRAAGEAAVPAGRYGSPEEFAAVAAFLCSTQASYVTGTQVRVDGGLAAGF